MGTLLNLYKAKKNLNEADSQMPGAYENPYSDRINQKLNELADATANGGFDFSTADDAYQQYRQNVTENAKNGAAAAAGTANALSGGYGSSWADSAANQSAGEQIAAIDTALSSLRGDALEQWKNERASTSSILSQLQGLAALDRSEYDSDVANANTWRDYLNSRVDTARQENQNFWNNVWTGVKGAANVARQGYDAYMGYKQQDWENQFNQSQFDFQKQQYADSLNRTQLSDQIAAMEQAQAFKQAGFDDLARQTLSKYGLDETMLDAWQGMSDVQKDRMSALLQGASLAGSGNDTAAKNYLQMAGLAGNATDSYSTIAGKQNASQLALYGGQLSLQNKYKTTVTGSSGSRSSSTSGRKSTGFTNSQLQTMANKFSSMKSTDPLYDFYKQTLTAAGWLADTGTGSSGKTTSTAGKTTSLLTRNAGTTGSLMNTNQGQQIVTNLRKQGLDDETIMDRLIVAGYSDADIAKFLGTK